MTDKIPAFEPDWENRVYQFVVNDAAQLEIGNSARNEGLLITQMDTDDEPSVFVEENQIMWLIERAKNYFRRLCRVNLQGGGYVRYVNHMGDEDVSISTARMSTGGENKTESLSEDWNDYFRGDLWDQGHMTPFEHIQLVVEIQCHMPVARQVYTYRTFSRNEYSLRYSEPIEVMYEPTADLVKGDDPYNKQGSSAGLSPEAVEEFLGIVRDVNQYTDAKYKRAREIGVAKQIARDVLPATQMTRFRISGNLRNWAHFLDQRTKADAQPQIQELAWGIAGIIKYLWPKHYAAMKEFEIDAVTLPATEVHILQDVLKRATMLGNGSSAAQDAAVSAVVLGVNRGRLRRFRKFLGLPETEAK